MSWVRIPSVALLKDNGFLEIDGKRMWPIPKPEWSRRAIQARYQHQEIMEWWAFRGKLRLSDIENAIKRYLL